MRSFFHPFGHLCLGVIIFRRDILDVSSLVNHREIFFFEVVEEVAKTFHTVDEVLSCLLHLRRHFNYNKTRIKRGILESKLITEVWTYNKDTRGCCFLRTEACSKHRTRLSKKSRSRSLSSYSSRKLNVLRHYSHTLRVNSAQVCIFK